MAMQELSVPKKKTSGLTERQIRFRQSGLGGSDIAALVRGDLLKLWLDKMGRSEFEGNRFTEWGTRLESAVLAKYEDEHDVKLYHPRDVWPGSVDGTLLHPKHAIALATPDGVQLRDALTHRSVPVVTHLVQAKCVGTFSANAYDDLPTDKLAQCMWELLVVRGCQADEGVPEHQLVSTSSLVALIGGNEWREYPIQWDAELADMLVATAEEFWETYVVTEKQPPVDGSAAATEFLKSRFAKNNGKMIPAPAGAYDLALEYDRASEEEKAAKARKDAAGNQLRALIGEADGLEAPGLKVTWKVQAGQPAYKAIAESLGASRELIAAHTPSTRVIRVNVKGAK